MTFRLRRSALYLPASNPRAIDKARALPCDVVILDLEDAVGQSDKAAARGLAVAAIRSGGFGPRELVVRCNALDTPWGREDLASLRANPPDAVLVPKIASPDDLAAYAAASGPGLGLWVMIETCSAVLRLDAIAAAAPVQGLVLGVNDLAREMRCRSGPDRLALQPAMALTVTAARAHGKAVLDGVYNALDDPEGLESECRQAAMFGFDGKTLIHPAQIAPCNRAFSPDADEVAWARAVIEAFALPQNAGVGALRMGGFMVERLHLEAAQRTLSQADAQADA